MVDIPDVVGVVGGQLQSQDAELLLDRERQRLAVTRKTVSGSGDMDELFSLDLRFRLVYLRCHFVGGSGTAPLSLSLDSDAGSAFDTHLFTVTHAGTGKDVNLRIAEGDTQEPSAWTLHTPDQLRVQWTNPDSGNMTWGLEVGLALAS